MSATYGPEQAEHHDELLQTVRDQVVIISVRTGLREPEVDLVRLFKLRRPTINAHFWMPSGVPTITITERAVRELSHDALRFMLTHEFGHFAHWDFRQRGWRRYVGISVLGASILVIGFVLLIGSISSGDFGLGQRVFGTGALIAVGGFLALRAHCRVDEYKVDDYAARQTDDLPAAREFFTALEKDRPPSRLGRVTRMWDDHPPLRDRLEAVQRTLTRNHAGRGDS